MNADRRPFFLDTAYVVAISNVRDQWYTQAARLEAWLRRDRRGLVTTEFVLAEIGDGLAAVRQRRQANRIIELLQTNPDVEIVPASADLFAAAFALNRAWADQGWGLTDCSSFVVMRERGLTSALPADAHFRQAGFRAHLLDDPAV